MADPIFAYTLPSGGVSIVYAAPKAHLEALLGELSDEEYLSHVVRRSRPENADDWIQLPDDWVGPDRSTRSTWRLVNGLVTAEPDLPPAEAS